jgi:surface protein
MFYNAKSFNQPIENWIVSKVRTMQDMFKGAIFFNQPIENWDVSNVKSSEILFKEKFFYPIIRNWNN